MQGIYHVSFRQPKALAKELPHELASQEKNKKKVYGKKKKSNLSAWPSYNKSSKLPMLCLCRTHFQDNFLFQCEKKKKVYYTGKGKGFLPLF